MKRAKKNYRYKNFTADTGHSLDWQIGFEDPFFDFLGIGEGKKYDKKVQKTLDIIRAAYFPPPDSCQTGTENLPMPLNGIWVNESVWVKPPCGSACQYTETKLPHLRSEIDKAQRQGGIPHVVEAYTILLDEYTKYYNSNCLNAPAPAPQQTGSTAPTTSQVSSPSPAPTPATTGTTSLTPSTANPGAATTTATTVNDAGASGQTGGTTPPTPGPTSIFSKVPKWAWWTAGGLAVVTAAVVIYKHNKS